jgi:L-alanine-DL-glutamate epimerase-like enolase superfamily enzyme
MRITAVDSFLLTIPYRTSGRLHFIAGRPSPGLAMLLVRVRTDEGLEGWGEAFGHAVSPATKVAIDTMIAPLFRDRDPSDIDALMEEAQRKLHIFGRNGPVIYGLSGVDIALWDIAAKAAGLPLYRLLGGDERRDVRAYSSLLRCAGPDAVAEACAAAVEHGYRHVKLHEITVPAVRAAREAVGADVALMVDTNCPWRVDEALRMVDALRPFDLAWLEEPVWPPEDYEGLAKVRAAGAVTAAGENVAGLPSFERLMRAGAVDVLQPSVAKVGGISAMRRIAAMAQALAVEVVPHCGYLGPGFLASVHLVAAAAGDVLLERLNVEVEADPLAGRTRVRDGRVEVPQSPGLGADPDPALVARFAAH